MIDVTVYTFENKSIFKIAHNNDKSDSISQDELYIPPTEVDDVINNGIKILSGCFDSFAYNNNFAYSKIGNTYYVVDIANEVKNEYSDDEFLKCIPIMKILIGMMHNSYIFSLFKNHNRH
ncbi:hypothetical protein [Ruminococcus sp.]|uniref:hypothetical protein n=1 Tax=Ruminococcus sp. TaxID=41978 RepID=UPI003FD87C87